MSAASVHKGLVAPDLTGNAYDAHNSVANDGGIARLAGCISVVTGRISRAVGKKRVSRSDEVKSECELATVIDQARGAGVTVHAFRK